MRQEAVGSTDIHCDEPLRPKDITSDLHGIQTVGLPRKEQAPDPGRASIRQTKERQIRLPLSPRSASGLDAR